LRASLFRDPGQPAIPQIRFSEPLVGRYRFRLWFEPGGFRRPGIEERPVIPAEAQSFLIALTADASKSKLADAYTEAHYDAVSDKVDKQVQSFGAIFNNWSRKDVAGTPHRRAFNERRRGQGRYGAGPRFYGSRKPIIGS
jgi:hypothetical protein